jgi:GT2 family glycosyltransferase
MNQKPKISVVLGSYNRLKYLKYTLQTVREELADFPHEIIIIDGGSTDGTMNWLEQQKDVVTIIQHNRGIFNGKPVERRSWGYFMNLGFKCAQGKYICMISDDCLVIPNAIKNGYKLFEQKLADGKKIGAVAFYYRNWPDEIPYKVQYALDRKMYVNHGLFLKSALEEVGYIDEVLYQFYYADSDLCLKLMQKGYDCIDSPESFIEHYKHANISLRKGNVVSGNSDLKNYLEKWRGIYHENATANDTTQERTFDDSADTVRLFRKIGSVRLFPAKALIRKLIKKIR